MSFRSITDHAQHYDDLLAKERENLATLKQELTTLAARPREDNVDLSPLQARIKAAEETIAELSKKRTGYNSHSFFS